MHRRDLVIFSALVIGAMTLLGIWAWLQLPADAQIPVHWGLDGQPNGYAPKTVGLFLLPLITLGIAAVFWAIPVIEPRRANIEKSGKAYAAIWVAVVLLMAAVDVATTAAALGATFDISLVVLVATGLLFIVIGNYLPKVRPELHGRDPDAMDADQRPIVGSDAPDRRAAVRPRRGRVHRPGSRPPCIGNADRRPGRGDRAHAGRPLRLFIPRLEDRSGEARDMTTGELLLLLTPVIVVEIVLIVFALRDLLRPERRVRGNSKLLWGIVIVFISLLGPIIYLAAGREEA